MTGIYGIVSLDSTVSEKDLVFYVDSELNFQCHVDQAASKANSFLSLVKSTFDHVGIIMFKLFFVCLVMPHLKYTHMDTPL